MAALLGLLALALHYRDAQLAHRYWRPDPLGERIRRFVEAPFSLSAIFSSDSTATEDDMKACMALLTTRRLQFAGRYTSISVADSLALASQPCSFRVQSRPPFAYRLSSGLAEAASVAAIVFIALSVLVTLALYRHKGWRRLSLAVALLVAIPVFFWRFKYWGYVPEALFHGAMWGLGFGAGLLALRELALWVRRGFATD